jgi:hypothetical protein
MADGLDGRICGAVPEEPRLAPPTTDSAAVHLEVVHKTSSSWQTEAQALSSGIAVLVFVNLARP